MCAIDRCGSGNDTNVTTNAVAFKDGSLGLRMVPFSERFPTAERVTGHNFRKAIESRVYPVPKLVSALHCKFEEIFPRETAAKTIWPASFTAEKCEMI